MPSSRPALLLGTLSMLFASPAWAAATLTIDAVKTEISADGLSTTNLVVTATRPDGSPLPDGAKVTLSSSLGVVAGAGVVYGGRTSFVLKSGTWPGTAEFSSVGFETAGDTSVEFVPDDGHATSLHLHGSFSEGDATMRGHTIEAEQQGVDVMWWTDHDYFHYPDRELEVTGYDFESGSLSYSVPFWPAGYSNNVGWVTTSNTFPASSYSVSTEAARSGAYGWRLSGTPNGNASWKSMIQTLTGFPIQVHRKHLLGQVDLSFWVRPQINTSADAEFWVTVLLSKGTDGVSRRIFFYHSNTSYASLNSTRERYIRIPATRGVWTQVNADLSAIARLNFPDFGEDTMVSLVAVSIKGRKGVTATYDVDDFSWPQETVGDDLRDLQRAYLDTLTYSPLQLVGQDIGVSDGRHLNAFGSSVPLASYASRDGWTQDDIVDWVHDFGGIASFNHMFGVQLITLDDLARAEEVVNAIDMLVSEGAWGCDLLEVGYREREGLLVDFLEVWDAISADGIVITGIGANDLHDQADWDAWENNFVTWVGSPTTEEDDLIWNLKRGMAWFGDPTLFADGDSRVELTSPTSQAVMGQVVVGATAAQDISIRVGTVQPGWVVRMVENGAPTETWMIEAAGDFAADVVIDPVGGNVVRFEVWSDTGQPTLYTNPIYFFDSVNPGELPDERFPAP